MTAPLPVALFGAGTRARTVYGPLLEQMDGLRLVGIVGRGEQRAQALASSLGVPWSRELEPGWGAEAAIVCVSSPENARVAHQVLDAGLPALLETPLALRAEDAAALAERIERDGAIVEIAEQNPRFPDLAAVIAARHRIGEIRLVATDGAGYRYHAAAVARALLGRPRGRIATGQRAVFPEVDVGRNDGAEEVLVGTVRAQGGALFQFRDAEAAWAGGPWSRGRWRAFGTRGEWADGLLGGAPLEPVRALEASITDDQQAVARCLLDWMARIDGHVTPTAWSAADGLADVLWIDAMRRSAVLGGAPIGLGR